MGIDEWIAAGTLLAAAVGLVLVVRQLRQQHRAMRAAFGNLFIQRYWAIDDALLFEEKGTKLHNQHRRRYLRLFEDEFDVAVLGFLDAQQWEAWHSELDDQSTRDRVEDDLKVCDPGKAQFVRLRACIAQRRSDGRCHSTDGCMGSSVANTDGTI